MNLLNKIRLKYNFGKFINDFAFTLVSLVFVGFSGIILQTIINNNFGTSLLGVYSQIISFYALFSSIGVFGIDTSTLKHAAEYNDDTISLKEIYSTSMVFVAVWSLFLVSCLLAVIVYMPDVFSSIQVAEGLLYMLPGIVLFALNKNSNSFLSGLRKMKLYSMIRATRWFGIMTLTSLLYFCALSFKTTLLFYSIIELLIFLFFLIYNKHYLIIVITKKWYEIHFKYGVTNIIAVVIGNVKSSFMVLVSGYYLTLEQVGTFAVILNFTNIFSLLTSAIQVNFNPIFARNWAKKEIDIINLNMGKIFKITKYSSILVYLFSIFVFSIYIIYFIDFSSTTIYYFGIVAFGTVLTYILGWVVPALSLSGHIFQNMVRNIYILFAQVIITISFLSFFGFKGALISYVLSEISAIAISYVMIKHYLYLNPLKICYETKLKRKAI